ncbi:transposase [Corynebacterium canis]|uniref:Transposase n=2 Tax=Corynebacterium canis TaxID=679663 RepID=A0A5C5TT25_9CORY|nr:helix-turn-helix domain-containing protein [Corynebacterium canis]TWT16827.1 transposase [Corynebacterium canis]
MVRPLSPNVRRLIVEFDPCAANGMSITEFCAVHGISRKTYYAIKKRFEQEGFGALHPRSSAPHKPATTYDEATVSMVLAMRERLGQFGWDNGPRSIWYALIDQPNVVQPIPSVSTIARILAAAGVVAKNPRKRPRSSIVRFERSCAMELWQLDAFSYRLATPAGTVITIYQLIDDATRFDVGTTYGTKPENGADALNCVVNAIRVYGVPRQLLSDNGGAFNQIRRGRITALHRFLAVKGCEAITGRADHPQTQGKNERSHQTLVKFLDAHKPSTEAKLKELLSEYREYYNNKRRHQALGGMTPKQAWDSIEHRPSSGEPITQEQLTAEIEKYRQARSSESPSAADGLDQDPAMLYIKPSSRPRFALAGYYINIPKRLTDKHYYVVHTDDEYALFDSVDGVMVLRIPLPLNVLGEPIGATVPLWKIIGAYLHEAPPWFLKRQQQWLQQHPTAAAELED